MTSTPPPRFDDAVAPLYERYLVPLIFEPYARDLARRVAGQAPSRVLEIAAGTGALTRELARELPPTARIVATDLNPSMLAVAESRRACRPVRWAQADALALPFDDGAFDAAACQFGAMFFPDRVRGYAEVRRVLAPGGAFAFNVWGPIADNEFAAVVSQAMAALFPADPPDFMARIPHGYHEVPTIRADLEAAGFGRVAIETVDLRSRAASAREVAIAYCQGTPMREEIVARDPALLDVATDVATAALADRFGDGAVEGRISALVALAFRP